MGVQYIADESGKRVGVILPVEEYERMVEELEDFEDILAVQAYDRAKAEIENGEDEVIPWDQAKKEIAEERAKRSDRTLYNVVLKRKAREAISRMPDDARERVMRAIEKLRYGPLPMGRRKLQGREDWRIRVGDYRIV